MTNAGFILTTSDAGDRDGHPATPRNGSISLMPAIYVPANAYTDPGVVSAFNYLDGRVLERTRQNRRHDARF